MSGQHAKLPGPALSTILAQAGSRWDERTGAVSMPIYQASTFRHPGLGQSTGFDYSRSANPTRLELEKVLAAAEGGVRALAFSTGMAAIDCALRLIAPGDVLVLPEDIYGGTWRIADKLADPWGVVLRWCDFEDLRDDPERVLQGARAVLFETPTNPTLKTLDIRRLAEAAKSTGALTIADTTFLTPVLCRPLELGCDVVVHSGTKYLGGHNDLLAGVAAAKDPAIAERLVWLQNTSGAVLGAFDSWLLMRGLKTLPLRYRHAQESAQKLAAWLRARKSGISKVYYPGYGAMVSFETDSHDRLKRVLESTRIWIYAESLGGTESLITCPLVQTHADMAPQVREKLGINDRLLRMSTGVEDCDDLIADLDQALG